MLTIEIKRGDTLTFAGLLELPKPDGGDWTGYSLHASLRAIGSDGYPRGDVLGDFTFVGPDADTGAFSMSCVMDMEAPVVGFDVVLKDPGGALVTTHGFVGVRLQDAITEIP